MASALRPTLLRQTALAARRAPCSFLTKTPIQSAISRDAVRVAAFHASSRRSLLPPGPQVIKGTVNDAVKVPDPTPTHGSYHWTFERLVAAGLVPLSVAPFVGGSLNPATDALLCGLLLVHSHTGLQSILIDYVPYRRYPGVSKAFMWMLNGFTVLVGVGLYEFETNDIGVTAAAQRIWKSAGTGSA
ncbi:mitochondrial succinate dehydrogenase cytochrome b560 subunit D [Xylariaceae sp. FL1019]|nr:mitochondrial succinate dehydrogenase cytochrome b560 subunit D [Xylariaceae sp. FL1019]